ncbi:MAG TPA: cytochrome c [Polyangiaceae bacterium]|nr:cytochrome c [Polyangiaceae bacterium]
MTRSLVGSLGVLLFALGVACDDPAHDLSEWTPADHTHQTEKTQKATQAQQRRQGPLGKPAAATYTPPSKRGGNLLVDVTWVKQCANCHGKRGRGDGPQSPMVKAKDLTDAAWQATVTDDQLIEAIKKGKGKMPAFNLPDSMVTDLVAKIREMPKQGKKGWPKGVAEPPAASAAPAAGAAPAAAPPPHAASAGATAPAPSAAPPPQQAPAAAAAEEDEDEAEGESPNAH